MAILVLEQSFDPPITSEQMTEAARRVDPCLERFGATWVRSFVSKDRRKVTCIFDAPDAEGVRQAYRSAGLAFESCWQADEYAVDKPAESY
jgi:hypothetical protein